MKETFPPQQTLVPRNELVVGSLGWQFGTWGAFLVIVAAWMSVQSDNALGLKRPVTLVALVGGLAMIGYELRRRRNRTALCVRGPAVGIYRGGALALAATRDQIVLFQTSYINTVKLVAAPIFIGALGLLPFSDLFNPIHDKPATADVLAGLALTAAGLISAASLVWTRHVWLTFHLPRKGLAESFHLRRSEASRLTG